MATLALALLLGAGLSAAPAELQVLSYNVAGLPIVHPRAPERLAAAAERLRESEFGVIALQEVWLERHARILTSGAAYPHSSRLPTRGIGSGLLTLSRWPILEQEALIFTCRPSALRAGQGESIAHKGALWTRIATPHGPLDVYNTHLISNYPNAMYTTVRLTQIFELAEFVLERSAGRPYAILADLNSAPGERGYEALRALLGLADPCFGKKEDCGPSGSDPRRVDHVLLPAAAARGARGRLAFTERVPGLGIPYSDHVGVAAALPAAAARVSGAPDPAVRAAALGRIEAAVAGMMEQMIERKARLSWIPVYGALLAARYDHQLAQLNSIRARVETARLRIAAADR